MRVLTVCHGADLALWTNRSSVTELVSKLVTHYDPVYMLNPNIVTVSIIDNIGGRVCVWGGGGAWKGAQPAT